MPARGIDSPSTLERAAVRWRGRLGPQQLCNHEDRSVLMTRLAPCLLDVATRPARRNESLEWFVLVLWKLGLDHRVGSRFEGLLTGR